MSKQEYGVYCDDLDEWCHDGHFVFHTDNLGVAVAQRDMVNRWCDDIPRTWRVRQFPDVGSFDVAGNFATMLPRKQPEAAESEQDADEAPRVWQDSRVSEMGTA